MKFREVHEVREGGWWLLRSVASLKGQRRSDRGTIVLAVRAGAAGCGWVRLGGLVRLGAGCRERCGKCGGPRVHGAYRGAESDVGGIVLAALLHGAVAADWHHAHHHTPPCTHRHAHTVMHLITYY